MHRVIHGRIAPLALASFGAALLLVVSARPARAAGEFVYPINGRVTSGFNDPRPSGNHGALDISAAVNTPVGAARAGRVRYASWQAGGGGNLVKIDHGSGYETVYAHLNAFRVRVGQQVSAGTTIGLEGSTGFSTGPHVHFAVLRYGAEQYLAGRRGDTVRKGAALAQTFSGLSGGSGSGGTSSTDLRAWAVTANALNVRTGPSVGDAILGQLGTGDVVISAASSGAWRRIWFRGRTAWCHGSWLARRNGVRAERVTANVLNVRTGPSTTRSIVGQAHRGEVYARRDTSGEWRKVQFDGDARWFHGDYAQAITVP